MTMTQTERDEIAPYKLYRVRQLMREKIYFIKCQGFVRISRSAQPAKWVLNGMQPFCPFELTIIKAVPGGLKLQKELEKTFCRYRHNSLWFRFEGEFRHWLESVNA